MDHRWDGEPIQIHKNTKMANETTKNGPTTSDNLWISRM